MNQVLFQSSTRNKILKLLSLNLDIPISIFTYHDISNNLEFKLIIDTMENEDLEEFVECVGNKDANIIFNPYEFNIKILTENMNLNIDKNHFDISKYDIIMGLDYFNDKDLIRLSIQTKELKSLKNKTNLIVISFDLPSSFWLEPLNSMVKQQNQNIYI